MLKGVPKISRQIYNQDVFRVLESEYSTIGPIWVAHQVEWMNGSYKPFKDHDKYLILISMVKSTLDFYSRHFIKLNYTDYYSKNTLEIEKINVAEVSKKTNIPKESTRRKFIELENSGVIKKIKNKVIIDRSAFTFVKPVNTIVSISRILSSISKILVDKKVLLKRIDSKELQNIIEDNFSYVWKIWFELQIPMMLSYKKVFGNLEAFHVFGTCVVNQHLISQKKKNIANMSRDKFLKSLYSDNDIQGLNAMSISDITGIPRATVVRKLKGLVNKSFLLIDEKKHYKLTGNIVSKLTPIQNTVLKRLADFSTRIFNLTIL